MCESCLVIIFGLVSEISIWEQTSMQMHQSPVKHGSKHMWLINLLTLCLNYLMEIVGLH